MIPPAFTSAARATYGTARFRPEVAGLCEELRALRPAPEAALPTTDELSPALLAALFERKVPSLTIPAAYGGWGAGRIEFAAVVEALTQIDAALAVLSVPHLGNGVGSIAGFGQPDQKEQVLRGLSEERRLISFALTEAHTGSDVASHRAKLTPAPEGGFRLNGSKTWVTNVPLAGHIVAVAKCPGLAPNPDGSAFVLLRPDDPGLSVSRRWEKLRLGAAPTVDLFFDDVPVGPERIVGEMGRAMDHFGRIVGSGRLGVAAAACALASRALELAQALLPADAAGTSLRRVSATTLAAMRATLRVTAFLQDAGDPLGDGATAWCKTFCTVNAEAVIREAHALASTRLHLVPPALRRLLLEIPVFKVFEGPNELLQSRNALALLTSLHALPAAEDFPLPACVPGAWSRDLHQLLGDYGRYLRQRAATRNFLAEPERLAEVGEVAVQVYVLLATVVYADTQQRQPAAGNGPGADEALAACERLLDAATARLQAAHGGSHESLPQPLAAAALEEGN